VDGEACDIDQVPTTRMLLMLLRIEQWTRPDGGLSRSTDGVV